MITGKKNKKQKTKLKTAKSTIIDVKNRGWIMGEGKGGTIWEDSIERRILPYVKQMTSANSMHEAGHSKPTGALGQPKGYGGEGVGKGVQDGGTHAHP